MFIRKIFVFLFLVYCILVSDIRTFNTFAAELNTSAYSNSSNVSSSSFCTFNGKKILNGNQVTAYVKQEVGIGEKCKPEIRTCNKGKLSGSAKYSSCMSWCSVSQSDNNLFIQPNLPNADKCLVINPKEPIPQGYAAVSLNYAIPDSKKVTPINWRVGDFTGFYPIGSTTQYGVDPKTYGSASLQVQDNKVGFRIDKSSLNPTRESDLIPFVYQYNWDVNNLPKPFTDPNSILLYSIDVQVPSVDVDNYNSFAYAYGFFIMTDTKSGLKFWYGSNLFDARGSSMAYDLIHVDIGSTGETRMPIVAGPVNSNTSRYVIPYGGSDFQSTTWKGYKTFNIAISSQNLINAVSDIKKSNPNYKNLSENPSDYVLEHFNFNPELAYFNKKTASMGISFKNIKISVIDGIVYRFYKQDTGEHFQTLSYKEGIEAGFVSEGIGFRLLKNKTKDTIPLYRCFSSYSWKHYISGDYSCENNGTNEGLLGYAYSSQTDNTIPLYRFYNPDNGDHLSTTNPAEVKNYNYKDEGLQGYVLIK